MIKPSSFPSSPLTPSPRLDTPSGRTSERHTQSNDDKSFWGIVEALLKDREALFLRIARQHELMTLIPQLIWLTFLCNALVGGILGSFAGGWNLLYVACKLPLLFLLTLGLCLGAFWAWALYFRLLLQLRQIIALCLMCIAVTSLLLLGLSPFLWQLLTGQSRVYHLAILAMVAIFGAAGAGGMRILWQGLQVLSQELPELTKQKTPLSDSGSHPSFVSDESPRGRAGTLAWVWIATYGLVGLQVSWILRPYLSHPWSAASTPFIRAWEGNVFASLLRTLLSVLGL